MRQGIAHVHESLAVQPVKCCTMRAVDAFNFSRQGLGRRSENVSGQVPCAFEFAGPCELNM